MVLFMLRNRRRIGSIRETAELCDVPIRESEFKKKKKTPSEWKPWIGNSESSRAEIIRQRGINNQI